MGQELSVSPSAYPIDPAQKDLRKETTTMPYVFYSWHLIHIYNENYINLEKRYVFEVEPVG